MVCSGNAGAPDCLTCTEGTPCSVGGTCRAGTISCAHGKTCVPLDGGVLVDAGTSCDAGSDGGGGFCGSAGACIACDVGAPCTPRNSCETNAHWAFDSTLPTPCYCDSTSVKGAGASCTLEDAGMGTCSDAGTCLDCIATAPCDDGSCVRGQTACANDGGVSCVSSPMHING